MKKILIIKHGGLGDLLQMTGVFSSLKKMYPKDRITLLTDIQFKHISKQHSMTRFLTKVKKQQHFLPNLDSFFYKF